jgi:cysteine desulfurase
MGVDDADGPLRFTIGAGTTEDDIDAVLEILPTIVARATH